MLAKARFLTISAENVKISYTRLGIRLADCAAKAALSRLRRHGTLTVGREDAPSTRAKARVRALRARFSSPSGCTQQAKSPLLSLALSLSNPLFSRGASAEARHFVARPRRPAPRVCHTCWPRQSPGTTGRCRIPRMMQPPAATFPRLWHRPRVAASPGFDNPR